MNNLTPQSYVQESSLEQCLDAALSIANSKLAEKGTEGKIETADQTLSAKEPISLFLKRDGKKIPIGVTYFGHLTSNFDSEPLRMHARTINELAQSIFKAYQIHEIAKIDPYTLITAEGVPFYSSDDVKVGIDQQGILEIDGKKVGIIGGYIFAEDLKGEEGIFFKKLENEEYRAVRPLDQRTNRQICFNLMNSSS